MTVKTDFVSGAQGSGVLEAVLVGDSTAFQQIAERVTTVHDRIAGMSQSLKDEHQNLVAVQKTLTECVGEIHVLEQQGNELHDAQQRQRTQDMVNDLRKEVEGVSSSLTADPLNALLNEQKKWIDAGLPEGVVVTDPEAVHFSVSTGLLHTILMFQRSADVLQGEEISIRIVDGKALFKVQGQYLPYEQLKDTIKYVPAEKRFDHWNFIHPDGFVREETTNIYPMAQLTPEAYRRVAHTASQFWTTHQEEIDPGKEKGYILQVITTGRPCFGQQTWLVKNLEPHTPEHSSSRLITPDGAVYSFGTEARPAETKKITSPPTFLATVLSYTPVPDYEETKPCDEKRVTSIPMTKERFESILRYANASNEGFPFNFPTQNCARFVTTQMAMAGVSVNVKMSVSEFLYGSLPNLSEVPYIGKPAAAVAFVVSCVARPIIDSVGAVLTCITPYPIKKVCELLTWCVLELFRRLGAVVYNALFYVFMGAGKSFIPPERTVTVERTSGRENELSLPTSSRLLQWWDIFNPDAINIYHSLKLKNWQMKQSSSVLYTKPKSGFSCLDPAKGSSVVVTAA